MSKKPNKTNDDFDIDEDLDAFDLNFDPNVPQPKDDRHPILKVGKGAVEGAKGAIKDPSFIKRALKETLPDGFGDTMDIADKAAGSLKNLYDESAREIKPAVQAVKKTTARLIPADAKVLPKSIKNLLERWRKEGAESQGVGADQGDAVAAAIQQTFAAEMELQQKDRAETQARENLKAGVDEIRHRGTTELLNRIAVSSSRLDQYQTNITLRWQKRTLELQYRQLFAAQELIKTIQLDSNKRDQLLSAIAKNTSLPDAVKIKDAEQRREIFKQKLYESIASGVYGKRNQYVEKFFAGISNKVIAQVKEVAGGIKDGVQQLDMANDMAEGMGVSLDPYEVGGSVAGDYAARALGMRGAKWLKKQTTGSKLGRKIDGKLGLSDKGRKLRRFNNDLPNRLNEFANNREYMWDDSLKGNALAWLQSLMPGMGVDTTTVRRGEADMNQPFYMTRRTDRSINDIIPGYLSRIFRELQVLRTGNDKIELTKFDHRSGRITSVGKVKDSVRVGVVDKNKQAMLKREMQQLMKQVDPKGELSPEVRSAIMLRMLSNSGSVFQASEERLASSLKYEGSDFGTAKKAADHMRGFLKGLDEEQRIKFETVHHRLAESMGDPREFIQRQIELGNQRELEQLGLIDRASGNINMEKVMSMYLDFPKEMRQAASANRSSASRAFADIVKAVKPKQTFKQKAAESVETIQKTIREKVSSVQKHVQDVYVEGEDHPRIKAALLQAGAYRTKFSNTVVTSLDALTEPIVDSQGNVVVDQSEMAKLVVYNAVTKTPVKVSQMYGSAMAAIKANPTMASYSGMAKVGAAEMIKSVANEFQRQLVEDEKQPSDVYVEGEKLPRLTAVLMKAGNYFNAKDGTPVNAPADIKGEVYDKNNKLMLSLEDLPNLRKFNSFLKKFTPFGMLRGLAKLAWKFQTKIAPKWAAFNLRMLWKLTKFGAKVALGVGKFSLKAMGVGGLGAAKAQMSIVDLYTKVGRLALSSTKLKAGYYYSAVSGKVIRTLKDIDGDVLEASAEGMKQVLSKEELMEGLQDLKGQAVQIGGQIKDVASSASKQVGGLLKRAGASLMGRGKAAMDKADEKLKNSTPESILGKLKGNYQQLRSKYGFSRQDIQSLEANKLLSQIRDALSPKKLRKGSYEDMQARLQDLGAKAKDGMQEARERAKKAAGGRSVGDLLGFDKLKGLLGMAGDVKDLAKGAAATGAGKIAGGALKGLGRSILGRLGIGAATTLATGAATAATSGGLLAGAASAATGLLTGAATVAGFLLSSPVIGAVALGAAAYGGYKLYKHVMRDKLKALGKLRMTQYGYKPEAADKYSHAIDLEKVVADSVVFKQGRASFDYRKHRMGDMMAPFGLDFANETHRDIFNYWFKKRFEPVYLTHMTALKNIAPETNLSDVDDLKGEFRGRFFDAVKFPEGPYGEKNMPYLPNVKIRAADSNDVQAAIAAVYAEAKEGSTNPLAKIIPSAQAAVIAATTAKAAQAVKKPGEDTSAKDKPAPAVFASTVATMSLEDGSRISAVDAVRFKTYGLKDLTLDKVKSLRHLEQVVSKSMQFKTAGAGHWSGDTMATLTQVQTSFGIAQPTSEQGRNWMVWFKNRFMPAFMNYVATYYTRVGRLSVEVNAANQLKAAHAYEVALAVVGTPGVWKMSASPWKAYILSTDDTSARDNLYFLQQAAEKQTLDEQVTRRRDKPSVPTVKPPTQGSMTKAQQDAAINKIAHPDAEVKRPATVSTQNGVKQGAVSVSPSSASSSLKLAPGELRDGRSAGGFVKLSPGTSINQLNPEFKRLLMGAIEEYGAVTGRSVVLTDGVRSYADQARMKKKYGNKAAAPGTSMHEFGLAIDADQKALDEMDRLGILRKYGLTRPVGTEPWHLEPIGIQQNLAQAKADAESAAKAIQAGIGKGGGGLGTMASVKTVSRSAEVSRAIMAAEVAAYENSTVASAGQTENQQVGKLGFARRQASASNQPRYVTASQYGAMTRENSAKVQAERKTLALANADAEVRRSTGGSKPLSQVEPDSKIRIPDPKGDGYEGMRDTLVAAAKTVGVDSNLILATTAMESDFKANAAAGNTSAQGPHQFVNKTWKEVTGKFGARYGISESTPRTDVKASALMTAHYFKGNIQTIKSGLGRDVTIADAYLTHLLGAGGARSFLTAMNANPNAIAANASESLRGAAAKNPNLFYDNGRPRTLSEVHSFVDGKIRKKAAEYGIDVGQPAEASQPSKSMPESSSVGQPTRQAVRPPMQGTAPMAAAAAYGASTQRPLPQPSGLSGEGLKRLEDIQTKQLDVQTKQLDVLMEIFGLMKTKNSSPSKQEAPKAPSAGPTYSPPEAAISMKRNAA